MIQMHPVLKWAGGKRQIKDFILNEIKQYWDEDKTYYEPFFGGGAIFFELQPKNAVINDLNKELMNVYETIKESPNKLISKLEEHKKHNEDEEYYYQIRELDRKSEFSKKSKVFKAARTIFLNKTCYNGLYRVNSQSQFNTPKGKYINPSIFDESNILEISKYLKENNIAIKKGDYKKSFESAQEGDLIYFDPPYDYEVENSRFTGYTKSGFSRKNLQELKLQCDMLIEKGCHVFLSNNKTDFVENLFTSNDDKITYSLKYTQKTIRANRNINSKGTGRQKVMEVLIYGSKSISSSK